MFVSFIYGNVYFRYISEFFGNIEQTIENDIVFIIAFHIL